MMIEDHAAALDDSEGQRKQHMACKLASAKEFLGSRYVLHPAYRPQENLHHSVHYKTSSVLAPVSDKARWCGRLQ